MYGKSFAESQKLFSGLHLNWLAKYSDRINESKCSVKERVFCLTYVSAGHSSLKLCKVSVKSIKNISPALCSTAGFHKPWSPEVFPVLEPEVQLAKQIPESLALLCGHEVSWGNILVCIFILEIDLKSNISIFWSILRMTVLSLNLPMQFKCSVFESSRRLHLPWTVQKQGGFFPSILPASFPPFFPLPLPSFLPTITRMEGPHPLPNTVPVTSDTVPGLSAHGLNVHNTQVQQVPVDCVTVCSRSEGFGVILREGTGVSFRLSHSKRVWQSRAESKEKQAGTAFPTRVLIQFPWNCFCLSK